MSAPIYSVRDGVIPAIVPSAPITEAHRKLACDVLLDHSVSGAATKDGVIAAAQWIANSEAAAVQIAMLREYGNLCAMNESLAKECDQLRAAIAKGQQNCDDAYDDLREERDVARAEVVRLKELHQLDESMIVQRTEALNYETEAAKAFCDDRNAQLARAERAEAELKRYNDAVDAQPWATDEPIRVLLARITIRLAAAETQLSTNHERAENIIKSREERIDSLGQEVTERRRDAQKSAALVGRLRRALADAISTYDPNRKETLVTAERQEALIAALQEDAK